MERENARKLCIKGGGVSTGLKTKNTNYLASVEEISSINENNSYSEEKIRYLYITIVNKIIIVTILVGLH